MKAKIIPDPAFTGQYRVVFFVPGDLKGAGDPQAVRVVCDHAGKLYVTEQAKAELLGASETLPKKLRNLVFHGKDHFPAGDKLGAVARGALSVIDGFIDIESLAWAPIHKLHLAHKCGNAAKSGHVHCQVVNRSVLSGRKGRQVERRAKQNERLAG